MVCRYLANLVYQEEGGPPAYDKQKKEEFSQRIIHMKKAEGHKQKTYTRVAVQHCETLTEGLAVVLSNADN